MKTYTKFLSLIFFKSFFYVSLIMLSLVFILNILSELEFFKEIEVGTDYTLLLCGCCNIIVGKYKFCHHLFVNTNHLLMYLQ